LFVIKYETTAKGAAIAYEMMVPSQMPRLGYEYLTAMLYGIHVRIAVITMGLVIEREYSVPLLLLRIIKVEVKTAGNAEAIPPRRGPPIWLNRTASKTRDPAPVPRSRISMGVYFFLPSWKVFES
jgi:hypothetical protein